MSHLDTLSSVTAPRGAHQLDEQQLLAYLQQQLPALRAFSGMCVRVATAHAGQDSPCKLLHKYSTYSMMLDKQQQHQPANMATRQQPALLCVWV